jgi:hypothetical protein
MLIRVCNTSFVISGDTETRETRQLTCGFSGDTVGDTGDTVETRSREPRSPAQRAYRRIGEWPDRVSVRRHGLAAGHARGVWTDARSGAVHRAEGVWISVEGSEQAFDGEVDLAFLATVAGHLRRCERCWKEWADGECPVELLTRAVERIPAGEVFRVLVKEIRANRPGLQRRRRG